MYEDLLPKKKTIPAIAGHVIEYTFINANRRAERDNGIKEINIWHICYDTLFILKYNFYFLFCSFFSLFRCFLRKCAQSRVDFKNLKSTCDFQNHVTSHVFFFARSFKLFDSDSTSILHPSDSPQLQQLELQQKPRQQP